MPLNKTKQHTGPVVDRSAPIPADSLNDFLKEEDEDEDTFPARKPAPRSSGSPRSSGKVEEPEIVIEPVLRRILSGPYKSRFLLLADWFDAATSDRGTEVSVETSVGKVKFSVIEWINTPGFLKLIVDSGKMPFEPEPMVPLVLRKNDDLYHVTCVSPLTPMFGDLPFAEIILVVDSVTNNQDNNMEKDAKLRIGNAPSTVSGKPSTQVDNDEPVADGEKAASLKGVLPPQDFDVSRGDREG
jgi:hypothetical protein